MDRFGWSLDETRTMTAVDVVATVAAFTLPLAYFDGMLVPSWMPRATVLLLVMPLGIWLWALAIRRRDGAAIAAFALVMIGTIATLVRDQQLWVIRGGIGRDSSATFLVALFSCWAIGRAVSPAHRRTVVAASLVALGLNAAFAVVQIIVAPDDGVYRLIGGRPSGFLVNPVYLGAVAAGGGVICVGVAAARSGRTHGVALAGFVTFVATTYLSGSRGALIGLAVGVVYVVARAGREQWLRLTGAVVGGLLIGHLLTIVLDSRSTFDRLGAGGSAGDGRFAVWRYALGAWSERPLLGFGYQQFRAATQARFDADFYRSYATRAGSDWPDAHNLVLQYAVIGGLLAVAALAAFVVLSARVARGPLAIAALAVGVTWLLQPVTLATGPIALLWLGMSMPIEAPLRSPFRANVPSIRIAILVTLGIGVIAAGGLIATDLRLQAVVERRDSATLDDVLAQYPSDPVLTATAASVAASNGDTQRAIRLTELLTELEPHDAVWWSLLATRRVDAGLDEEAAAAVGTALAVDPWHPLAHRVAFALALRRGDDAEADHLRDRLCRLAQPECETGEPVF